MMNWSKTTANPKIEVISIDPKDRFLVWRDHCPGYVWEWLCRRLGGGPKSWVFVIIFGTPLHREFDERIHV
jgi:hypothetical protein